MMKSMLILLFALSSAWANPWQTSRENWGGTEVVLLVDENYPTYDLTLYFADGALSDQGNRFGETQMMLDLLEAGTRRYGQREIADHLEYYGASTQTSLTHEYATYSVSGLAKDIVPTLKKVCHIFSDATYPKNEVAKYKKRAHSSLTGLVSNHSALVDRAFRWEVMRQTSMRWPTSGTLKSLKRIQDHHLRQKLEYFKKKVKKRLYFTGPKRTLKAVKSILLDECDMNWGDQQFRRTLNTVAAGDEKEKIILVTVPKANQAQIRMGKIVPPPTIEKMELMALTASFLGGGFTSLLNYEIRVKRGLSYGAGAMAPRQKDYGRSAIYTSTKSQTTAETLRVIRDSVHHVERRLFTEQELDRARRYLAGSYHFRFETRQALLGQMMQMDHMQIPFERLLEFPQKVRSFDKKNVGQMAADLFRWDDQVIVVVGEKKIAKELKKLGPVKVVSYTNYL